MPSVKLAIELHLTAVSANEARRTAEPEPEPEPPTYDELVEIYKLEITDLVRTRARAGCFTAQSRTPAFSLDEIEEYRLHNRALKEVVRHFRSEGLEVDFRAEEPQRYMAPYIGGLTEFESSGSISLFLEWRKPS